MKFGNKILVGFAAFTLTVTLMSCAKPQSTPTTNFAPGSSGGTVVIPPKANLIFSTNVQPNIICNNADELAKPIEKLSTAVFSTTYMTPKVFDEKQSQTAHELVIGKTERDISKTAYRYLERLEHEEGEISYLVYSNGSSLAVAYDEDKYKSNAAAIQGINELIGYLNGDSEIIIPKGVLVYKSFDALDYQRELDDAKDEAQWKKFEEKVNAMGGDGAAVAKAVKEYYQYVCTENVVSWFANLYDPAVGGYYFSNSARNTPGFLPDIESTQQAIGQLNASGMLRDVDITGTIDGDASYINGLPEWFRTQVIRFLKSLQDPETGFFYHPQWTKEEVNQHLSRRSRDMSRAVGILQMFASDPTYDTPDGDIGDGVLWNEYRAPSAAPDSNLTGRLIYGASAPLAVSKVIPTASVAIPSHMISVNTFKAYLAEQLALNKAGKRSFYSIGNEIGTQTDQIKKRDKELDPTGATQPLGDTLIAWYTEHQNKETGLWDAGLSYDNTNAILKIGGTYTEFGYIFPNADKAFASCVQLLTTDEVPHAIVEVYNVWYAISNLMININEMATNPSDIAYAENVRKELLLMAPEAIKLSAEKQLEFKHPDGSFGYTVGSNCVTSQGMRVAPPGNGEGDVNATVIAMSGTINNCLKALGLDGYAPGYFGEAERLRYVAILEELGPVIKNDIDVPIDYTTFDDEEVGNNPSQTDIEMNNKADGSLIVVERKDEDGNAVEFSHKGGYETLKIVSQSGALNASCFAFESDIMIKDAVYDQTAGTRTAVMQLLMQPAIYMITVQIDSEGNVRLMESSSTSWATAKEQDLGVKIPMGKWFNLKVKYYVGDHDTVRIKVFINNELIAVTDNYFDSTGNKLTGVGEPVTDVYDYLTVTGLSSSTVTALFDDLAVYATGEIYKRVPASQKQPAINIDPPDREQVIYDFDDNVLPEDFTVNGTGAAVEDGRLAVMGNTDTAASIALPINVRFGTAKCAILDTDITVSTGSTGTVARFWFTENAENTTPVVCFDLVVKTIDGVAHTVLVEAANGNATVEVAGTAVELGKEFNLRMEYYESERATLIYINDDLAGLSGATCKNAEKYTVRTLVITSIPGTSFDVKYDNFIFEKDILDFKQTTTSEDYPAVEHNFDTIPDGALLEGGAEVKNGYLVFGKKDAALTLPLVDRNIVTNAASVSIDISHDSVEGGYVFTLVDSYGSEIISFEAVVDEDSIDIYEYYAGGRGMRLGSTALKASVFTLGFKYYYKEAVMNITVNGEGIAATALTHLYERDSLTPAALKIKQLSGISLLNIDKCYAERTIDIYRAISVAASDTPAIESTQTFETSSFGNYPKAITYTLSTSSRLAVKAMLDGTNVTKMLALTTVTGANDSVIFALSDSNKVSGAKAVVYEADMIFDMAEGAKNAGIEIYFRQGSNYNARYIIYLGEDNNRLGDWWNGSGGKDKPLGVDEGERFKVRFEYTVQDDTVVTNIFINGIYLGSCTRAGANIAVEDIDKVVFYAQLALNGTVCFDNVKLYQTTEITPIN